MKITTSKGLWVSSFFTEKFGNKDIPPAKTVPGFKVLSRNMTDAEIKAEFGPQECTLEDVAAFLKKPPKGTDDGYWNLFYVSGFVVGVCWGADAREWYVFGWSLDGLYWLAGRRVFSRNFIPLEKPSGTQDLDLETAIARVKLDGYTVVKIV